MLLVLVFMFVAPAALVLIAISISRARRRRRRSDLWLAAVAAVGLALTIWAGFVHANWMMHYWDGWDLNPEFEPTEVVGTWRCHTCTEGFITFNSDGSYLFATGERGTWRMPRLEATLPTSESWRGPARVASLQQE